MAIADDHVDALQKQLSRLELQGRHIQGHEPVHPAAGVHLHRRLVRATLYLITTHLANPDPATVSAKLPTT